MNVPAPHFLLFSESVRTSDRGQWRFVLQSLDGTDQIEATDTEPNVQGERLELLAVVRGLEALPQPSRVTLVTPSRYVNRGLNYGLAEWRTNDWQWEHFGEMAPIKNRDLWQRVDRALEFHRVDCRLWRFDMPGHSGQAIGRCDTGEGLPKPHFLSARPEGDARKTTDLAQQKSTSRCDDEANAATVSTAEVAAASRVKLWNPAQFCRALACTIRRRRIRLSRSVLLAWETGWLRLGQCGTRLLPPPWFE